MAKFGVPPGVDPRLPGARRRRLGRLSRPARLGRRSRRRRCSRGSATSRRFPADWRDWQRQRREPRARWPRRWRASASSAFLFRDLATLRTDIPLFDSVDELAWNGPTPAFAPLAARLDKAAG